MSKQLPELQRQVKLDATVPQDYTQAYGALAAVPSALGQYGAEMAQQASNAFSMKMGYEAGKNPKGSLLPAVTQSDAAYVKAYEASSQATLTVNGQEAMLKSQLLLSKKQRLTQNDIDAYHSNMRKAIDEQLALAPDSIKPSLKQTLDTSLARSSANLTTQLIKQNKQDQIDTVNMYTQNMLSNILETSQHSPKDAESMLKQYNETIDTYGSQNVINKLAVQSSKEAALISYHTGLLIGEGKLAQHKQLKDTSGKSVSLGQHMAKVNEMSFDGLSYNAQQTIKSNYIKQMAFDQRMNEQDQKNVIAKGVEHIASGTMTSDYMAMAKQTLTDAQYSTLNTKLIVSQQKQAQSNNQLFLALKAYNSPEVVNLPTKAHHAATMALVQSYMQEHKGSDQINALGSVLSSAGGQDSMVTDVVNQAFKTGGAQEVNNYIRLVNYLHSAGKATNLPLSNESENVMTKYQNVRAATPSSVSDDEVLSTVRNAMFNKSPDQLQANNTAWNDFRSQNLSTPQDKTRFAKKMFNHNLNNFENPVGAQNRAHSLFEINFRLNDGDVDTATQITQRQLSIAYGSSSVNGGPSFTIYPIEKFLGVGEKGLPFIWADMAQQFAKQVESNNTNKNSPIRYEVVNAPDINKLAELTKKYEELGAMKDVPIKDKPKFMEEIRNTKREIDAILNSGPPKVIKHTGKDKEEYTLGLRAAAPIGIAQVNLNQFVGDWDLILMNSKGRSVSINGTYNLSTSVPFYRPNATNIVRQFSAFTHTAPETYEQLAERYKQYREEEKSSYGQSLISLSQPSIGGVLSMM